MIHIMAYTEWVEKTNQNRALMARIGLNAMGFEAKYPVDVSELARLDGVSHAIVNGLLMWSDIHRKYNIPSEYSQRLEQYAQTPPTIASLKKPGDSYIHRSSI